MSLASFTTLPPPPSLPPLLLPPLSTGITSTANSHHHHHLPNGTLSSSRLLSPPPTPTLSTSSVFRTPPLPKGSPPLPHKPLVYHNGGDLKEIGGYLGANNVSHVCVHRLCVRQNGQPTTAVEICTNDKGEMVKHGEPFIPQGGDTCTQCTCMNGKAEMCISVLCSPPDNCRKFHKVSGNCCEFLCLEGDMTTGFKFFNKTILTKGEKFSSLSTSNLGLRLIASTITSFLILALLLFMIHRLRQRRLLLMIRRLQTRRLEQINGGGGGGGGSGPNSAGSHLVNEHAFRFGYFGIGGRGGGAGGGGGGGGRDSLGGPLGFGFIEPPPPYTFWKPPEQFIAPGEAPPSYEETINPNTPTSQQTLPMVFPVDMTAANQLHHQQPGINPQVQHLNVQYHGNGIFSGGAGMTTTYPYSTLNSTTGALPLAPPPLPQPGRIASLINSSLTPLFPVRPARQGVLPPLPIVPNVHLNRLGPGLEPGLDARDPGPLSDLHHYGLNTATQTYSKGHYLAPSSHLVRHNSMPMSRNAFGEVPATATSTAAAEESRGTTTLRQHPSFQHTISGTYQHLNSSPYQQRLVTHLASPLNEPSQAYVTSPLQSTTTAEGTVELHSNPFLENNVPLENPFDHITVLRIGTPNGSSSNGSSTTTAAPSPASCRIYGNGRLIGHTSTLNQSPSFREPTGNGSHYESHYNSRGHTTTRPQSALVMTTDVVSGGNAFSSSPLPTTIIGNRTLISTEYVPRPRTSDSSSSTEHPQLPSRPKSSSLRAFREPPPRADYCSEPCDSPEPSQNLATTSATSASTSSFSTSLYSLSLASTPSSSAVSSPTSEEAPATRAAGFAISTTSSSTTTNSELITSSPVPPSVISVTTTSSSSSTTSSTSSSSGQSSSHASQSTVILRGCNNSNNKGASSSLDDPTDEDELTLTEDGDLQSSSSSSSAGAASKAKLKPVESSSSSFMTISRL